jgi:hypothetical protein
MSTTSRGSFIQQRSRPAKASHVPPSATESQQYWKVAPGRDAIYWDDCLKGGYICVGWSKFGDLAGVDLETFHERQRRLLLKDRYYTAQGSRQLWTFAHDIRIGAKVIANHGLSEVLGIGTVTGPHYFAKAERDRFPNRLPVKWEDTRIRRVNEKGWFTTLRRLERKTFEAILRSPTKNQLTGSRLPTGEGVARENVQPYLYPDEVNSAEKYLEGATTQVMVNVYERNSGARRHCLAHYGAICQVCRLDFAERYGVLGQGFIHVHHLRQLAKIGKEYEVDPIEDLLPICPNCHAMLHQTTPPLRVNALRRLMGQSTEKLVGDP